MLSSLVVVFLLVGFPVALIFAWVHQMPTESGAGTRASTGKLDWFLASALVVVIALVSYQQLAPVQSQQAEDAKPGGPSAQAGVISVAVLPFVNLSSDAEQEFFSDGMTEEVTSALARVPGLIVIGRTSAFEFKGQNRDLRMIGQALGTTHLIEGSVRRLGPVCESRPSSLWPTAERISGPRITTASLPTCSPSRKTSPERSPGHCACR